MNRSRRTFIGGVLSVTACSLWARNSFANALGLPLAIQLYSVREQMAEDLDMALAAVASAGFVEVEAAALPKKSAREIRGALDKAGLRCVSAHHPFADLASGFDEVLAYDKELGARYIICSSPGHRVPGTTSQMLSLDDWRFNADEFNEFGERTLKSGVQFGYHNHVHEFQATEGTSPYAELLKRTDPKKVTFELDCGWARVAGHSPVELMQSNPHRFSMLHVKDFHLKEGSTSPSDAKVTELGRGDVDYRPVLSQARKNQNIRHLFVEQEAFDMPWKESLKIDAEYMRALS